MENKEIIIGRNPVSEYLKNIPKQSGALLFVAESAHGKIIDSIKDRARDKGVQVQLKDKKFFNRLGSSSQHQGVALEVKQGHTKQEKKRPEDLIKETAEKQGLLILLDHLTDPHNVGAIIRSAEALGCTGVIMPSANAIDITPTVVKASAGATAHIPVVKIANVARFLDLAKDQGLWIIGTTDHGSHALGELKDVKPAVLVIGSEGSGMKRLTEEKCDYLASIPLPGEVSSLNASVAAGIAIYVLLNP